MNNGGHAYVSGDTVIKASMGIYCGAHACATISDNADLSACETSIKCSASNSTEGSDMVVDVLGGKVSSLAGNSTATGITLNVRNTTVNGVIHYFQNVNLYEGTVVKNSSESDVMYYCNNIYIEGANITGRINGCNVTMDGGSVKSSNTYGAIYSYDNRNIKIISGKVEGTNGPGIKLEKGTLTLGSNDSNYPDQANPEIVGTTYGVEFTGSTFNFYDGVIKGGTSAFSGTIQNTPEMFKVVYDDDTEKIARLGIDATYDQVAMVNGIYYEDIETAIAAAINNNGQIDLAKNVVTATPIEIPADASISINLSGFSITAYCSEAPFITNNGTLVIKDETDDGTNGSTIRNYFGSAIENNGTLTLGIDDSNVYTNAPKIIGTTNAIINNGTITVYDGQYSISEESGTAISGDGEIIVP